MEIYQSPFQQARTSQKHVTTEELTSNVYSRDRLRHMLGVSQVINARTDNSIDRMEPSDSSDEKLVAE